MIYSTKYSYLILRIGLAAVFFWFGIDKFFHPGYWLSISWVPTTQLVYLNGVFEVLIALSLATGVFNRIFSLLGSVFLLSLLVFSGFNTVSIRDVALIAGLLAVFLWPDRTS